MNKTVISPIALAVLLLGGCSFIPTYERPEAPVPASYAQGGTPSAAAAIGAHTPNLGYASERDTARWIATCRAQYGAVAEQLEQILDIEDNRERAAAALAAKTAGEGAQ